MTISIDNYRIYRHQVMHINYTTYNNRRAQDTVNPRTRPDIMMLSGEKEDGKHAHPYWYARVLGIYHVRVLHTGMFSKSSQLQSMEFLHVRWFGHDINHRAGWRARRLHRVSFLDEKSEHFGFVDPSRVIRAAHLIPAFASHETEDLLGPSTIARRDIDGDADWRFYYVSM